MPKPWLTLLLPPCPKLSLNCWLVGNDPHNIFPVKIQSSVSVGTSKEVIKEKKPEINCAANLISIQT
ncbi:hypothetical protein K503DRAFT_766761 [Rhizopogon vinicolor AM-OR11-026]|uniref:Crinkler effector protein N-terminal domain-containing protein n=1 Tax=Rhizopogon vinicolor AM-OR11-026 TaxID=1314800 RepID=A0A1B7NCH3_9AGAM|nr:hypothetical protein K503DRAFT_766761 [Rhizopogon vinicolor AM-OR11-026]